MDRLILFWVPFLVVDAWWMIYEVRELNEHLIILYFIYYRWVEYFFMRFMHYFCSVEQYYPCGG